MIDKYERIAFQTVRDPLAAICETRQERSEGTIRRPAMHDVPVHYKSTSVITRTTQGSLIVVCEDDRGDYTARMAAGREGIHLRDGWTDDCQTMALRSRPSSFHVPSYAELA